MKNSLRQTVFLAILIIACLAPALELGASRPAPSEVAKNKSQNAVYYLGKSIESLSTEQLAEFFDRRKGVKLIDGRILKLLMDRDAEVEQNRLYDDIMALETGDHSCRFYCIFNIDMKNSDSQFFLLDTRHGHFYGSRDDQFYNLAPRDLFKKLCTLTGNDEFYEQYSTEFLNETAEQKKEKATSARNSPFMVFLAKYWFLLVLFSLGDFIFIDFSYMKTEKWPVKLYGLGLHLVCTIICLSIVTIHYTNTPIPGFRSFSHLASGCYPRELYTLSDVILVSSFSWWAISISATFLAPKFKCSPVIPLLYVVSAPMALAMSESPFKGTQSVAFPLCGLLMMFINAIYIKKKYQTGPQ
jgi:hypothetical protein